MSAQQMDNDHPLVIENDRLAALVDKHYADLIAVHGTLHSVLILCEEIASKEDKSCAENCQHKFAADIVGFIKAHRP